MKMFKPINERILVRLIPEEERADGLYLPSNPHDFSNGKIVLMGKGANSAQGQRIEPEVKVGDTILFESRGVREVKVDGEKLLLMTERQIVGIITSLGSEPLILPVEESC